MFRGRGRQSDRLSDLGRMVLDCGHRERIVLCAFRGRVVETRPANSGIDAVNPVRWRRTVGEEKQRGRVCS